MDRSVGRALLETAPERRAACLSCCQQWNCRRLLGRKIRSLAWVVGLNVQNYRPLLGMRIYNTCGIVWIRRPSFGDRPRVQEAKVLAELHEVQRQARHG